VIAAVRLCPHVSPNPFTENPVPSIAQLQTKKSSLISTAQQLVNQGKAASSEYRSTVAELDLVQGDINSLTLIESL
jgi:hypothetical protein